MRHSETALSLQKLHTSPRKASSKAPFHSIGQNRAHTPQQPHTKQENGNKSISETTMLRMQANPYAKWPK